MIMRRPIPTYSLSNELYARRCADTVRFGIDPTSRRSADETADERISAEYTREGAICLPTEVYFFRIGGYKIAEQTAWPVSTSQAVSEDADNEGLGLLLSADRESADRETIGG